MSDVTDATPSRDTAEDRSALEAMLSNAAGKRVLLSIISRCGIYASAYTGDRDATHVRLGEQNVGLWLLSMIEMVDPMAYPKMLSELAKRATKKDRENVKIVE